MGLAINKNIIFVVCQHGGEKTPLRVIEDNFKENLDYIVANKEAVRKNRRFIDSDLNRSFPGNKLGNKEEKLADLMLRKLKKYDFVLDLHTTTVLSPIFIITTKLDLIHFELINSLNISKVVIMQDSFAKGNSLIDHVSCGISIEAGQQGSRETYEVYRKFLDDYLCGKKAKEKDFYIIFGSIEKHKNENLEKSIQSFKLVKKGDIISKINGKSRIAEYDFYPIMPGEKSYKGVLTLTAKKVNLEKLKQIREL